MSKAKPTEREREEHVAALTKRDFIIAVWESLDCESIGAFELGRVQDEVAARFGDGAVDSPAAVARILADEGAHLRHPEILEFDTQWRQRKLSHSRDEKLDFSSLAAARKSFAKLETLRRELPENDEPQAWRQLRRVGMRSKEDCLLRAASPLLKECQRAEAKEIAGWFSIWLQTPELFEDWLDLRCSSSQFRKRFE